MNDQKRISKALQANAITTVNNYLDILSASRDWKNRQVAELLRKTVRNFKIDPAQTKNPELCRRLIDRR